MGDIFDDFLGKIGFVSGVAGVGTFGYYGYQSYKVASSANASAVKKAGEMYDKFKARGSQVTESVIDPTTTASFLGLDDLKIPYSTRTDYHAFGSTDATRFIDNLKDMPVGARSNAFVDRLRDLDNAAPGRLKIGERSIKTLDGKTKSIGLSLDIGDGRTIDLHNMNAQGRIQYNKFGKGYGIGTGGAMFENVDEVIHAMLNNKLNNSSRPMDIFALDLIHKNLQNPSGVQLNVDDIMREHISYYGTDIDAPQSLAERIAQNQTTIYLKDDKKGLRTMTAKELEKIKNALEEAKRLDPNIDIEQYFVGSSPKTIGTGTFHTGGRIKGIDYRLTTENAFRQMGTANAKTQFYKNGVLIPGQGPLEAQNIFTIASKPIENGDLKGTNILSDVLESLDYGRLDHEAYSISKDLDESIRIHNSRSLPIDPSRSGSLSNVADIIDDLNNAKMLEDRGTLVSRFGGKKMLDLKRTRRMSYSTMVHSLDLSESTDIDSITRKVADFFATNKLDKTVSINKLRELGLDLSSVSGDGNKLINENAVRNIVKKLHIAHYSGVKPARQKFMNAALADNTVFTKAIDSYERITGSSYKLGRQTFLSSVGSKSTDLDEILTGIQTGIDGKFSLQTKKINPINKVFGFLKGTKTNRIASGDTRKINSVMAMMSGVMGKDVPANIKAQAISMYQEFQKNRSRNGLISLDQQLKALLKDETNIMSMRADIVARANETLYSPIPKDIKSLEQYEKTLSQTDGIKIGDMPYGIEESLKLKGVGKPMNSSLDIYHRLRGIGLDTFADDMMEHMNMAGQMEFINNVSPFINDTAPVGKGVHIVDMDLNKLSRMYGEDAGNDLWQAELAKIKDYKAGDSVFARVKTVDSAALTKDTFLPFATNFLDDRYVGVMPEGETPTVRKMVNSEMRKFIKNVQDNKTPLSVRMDAIENVKKALTTAATDHKGWNKMPLASSMMLDTKLNIATTDNFFKNLLDTTNNFLGKGSEEGYSSIGKILQKHGLIDKDVTDFKQGIIDFQSGNTFSVGVNTQTMHKIIGDMEDFKQFRQSDAAKGLSRSEAIAKYYAENADQIIAATSKSPSVGAMSVGVSQIYDAEQLHRELLVNSGMDAQNAATKASDLYLSDMAYTSQRLIGVSNADQDADLFFSQFKHKTQVKELKRFHAERNAVLQRIEKHALKDELSSFFGLAGGEKTTAALKNAGVETDKFIKGFGDKVTRGTQIGRFTNALDSYYGLSSETNAFSDILERFTAHNAIGNAREKGIVSYVPSTTIDEWINDLAATGSDKIKRRADALQNIISNMYDKDAPEMKLFDFDGTKPDAVIKRSHLEAIAAQAVKNEESIPYKIKYALQNGKINEVQDLVKQALAGGTSTDELHAIQGALGDITSTTQKTSHTGLNRALDAFENAGKKIWNNKAARYGLGAAMLGSFLLSSPDSHSKSKEVLDESKPQKRIPAPANAIDPSVGYVKGPSRQGYKLSVRGNMPANMNTPSMRSHMGAMGMQSSGQVINRTPGVDDNYVNELMQTSRDNNWNFN